MTDELNKKIQQAIRLIQTTCKDRGTIEVAYSGGKDSDEEIRRMYQTTGVESTQNVTCETNEETNLK